MIGPGMSMFVDLLEHDWVMKPIVEFESTDDLLRLVPERVINVAEARVASRRQKLAELFEGDGM